MNVEPIFISPVRRAEQMACERVVMRSGAGIVGDRNFGLHLHPGQNLTLIEAEAIESFFNEQGRLPDLSLTRRNLVTRGIRLNTLLGREFSIGAVRLRGVELCEPCVDLGGALSSDLLPAAAVIKRWVGRGGLRVDVLSDGEIARADALVVDDWRHAPNTE
jgi:MOSC domain-containing protein YiiM